MENKEILLKELGSRLSHNVKLSYKYKNHIHILSGMTRAGMVVINDAVTDEITTTDIENVKPYLFPLSSMTDEQIMQSPASIYIGDLENLRYINELVELEYGTDVVDLIDWFEKNHFDYRGLIEKGLAIDATGKNIY